MGKFSIPWVNDGQSLVARSIPQNGRADLLAVEEEFVDARAALTNSYRIWFQRILLSTKKELDNGTDPGKVRLKWDSVASANGWANVSARWKEPDFTKNINAWVKDLIFAEHEVKLSDGTTRKVETVDEADGALTAAMKASNDALAEGKDDLAMYNFKTRGLTLYWTLRSSGATEITPPGEDPIRINWKDKAGTLKLIGDYATDEDYADLIDAVSDSTATRDVSHEDFKQTTSEAMLGKSVTGETSLTT